MEELTESFEGSLEEDRALRNQMEEEKRDLLLENEETKRQLEEDIDSEIELLKAKNETKLNAEREATLRYKGENGIMNKKFTQLEKDIEQVRGLRFVLQLVDFPPSPSCFFHIIHPFTPFCHFFFFFLFLPFLIIIHVNVSFVFSPAGPRGDPRDG